MVTRSFKWGIRILREISMLFMTMYLLNFSTSSSPMKVLVDTDPGGDDAVALLLLLATKKLDVVAITCTYGNVSKTKVENNALKILTIANQCDTNGNKQIPVYSGAVKPILKHYEETDYYGKDGLGDFTFDQEITYSIDRSKHASLVMIELSKKYPGDLNIIVLGPLTNVALAIQLDPDFAQRINRFYVMGGLLHELQHGGKVEFNFGLDPESNAIFLNSPMRQKSLIIPWDIIATHRIQIDWRENVLGKLDSTAMKFLNKVEYAELRNDLAWYPADAIAVALVIWPDLITSSVEAYMTVETHGPLSGMVNADLTPPQGVEKNVEIVIDFHIESFKDKLLKYLG